MIFVESENFKQEFKNFTQDEFESDNPRVEFKVTNQLREIFRSKILSNFL